MMSVRASKGIGGGKKVEKGTSGGIILNSHNYNSSSSDGSIGVEVRSMHF